MLAEIKDTGHPTASSVLGVRRNHARNSSPATERPSSRDLVDYFPFFLSFLLAPYLMSSSPSPCARQQFPSSLTIYASQSKTFLPSLPHSFFSPLFSTSCLTLSNNTTLLPRGTCTLSFSSLFSLPFMLTTFLSYHHHRQPRGRRYYTKA